MTLHQSKQKKIRKQGGFLIKSDQIFKERSVPSTSLFQLKAWFPLQLCCTLRQLEMLEWKL